jgi:hypothetical protein
MAALTSADLRVRTLLRAFCPAANAKTEIRQHDSGKRRPGPAAVGLLIADATNVYRDEAVCSTPDTTPMADVIAPGSRPGALRHPTARLFRDQPLPVRNAILEVESRSCSQPLQVARLRTR